MSDKQPEALQDPQMQMWLEYCAMKEEVARLHEVNAELVESLKNIAECCGYTKQDERVHEDAKTLAKLVIRDCNISIRKAQGDNNENG